ncbi:FxSxx-COOH system tetratricopeptide repeat protein [Streptomyces sp. NPDC001970]
MSGEEQPLLIEPVVSRPHEADAGSTYLVTVDLRGPLAPDGSDSPAAWPGPGEELTFTVGLDGSPHFVCEVLDDPGVVLHRYGGTYGPARFVVTAGRTPGPAALWLTINNQWGMPVRKAELPCRIRDPRLGEASGQAVVGYLPGADSDRQSPSEEAYLAPTAAAPPTRGVLRALLDWPRRRFGAARRAADGAEPPSESLPARDDSATARRPPESREALQRERLPRPAPAASSALAERHVLVAFAASDRDWATRIGDRLERRGLAVTLHRLDPTLGTEPSQLLRDLALAPGRILLVLSDAFFRLGAGTEDRWERVLRDVVIPDPDRFAAVAVGPASSMPAATEALAPLDVLTLGSEEAEGRLLRRLGLPAGPLPRPEGEGQAGRTAAVMGGVPHRNARFTGREELLETVRRFLTSGPDGARVTLLGMSGVGKTQLAAEFVHRFASAYDVVWWVPADVRASCRARLAELAPALGLRTGAEYGERLRAVRDALRLGEPYGRWLLVFDAADDVEAIADLVPSGPGHVLITSRNRSWMEQGSDAVEVPTYSRDESVAFVMRRAPRLTAAEADRLAAAMEDLPLLLDQTAGWLGGTTMPVDEYIGLVERIGADRELVNVSHDFPLSFRSAWSILLDTLRETYPWSVELLRLCTFFAPASVPIRLLRAMRPDALPEQLRGLVEDPRVWDEAVRTLVQFSLVRLETEGPREDEADDADDTAYLSMHRLVHLFVREGIPEAERAHFTDAARLALAAADPGRPTDSTAWSSYAEITPHLRHADVLGSTDPAVQDLALNCLRYMYVSGEYGAGIRTSARAMASWRELLGATHPRIWDLSHHYANLLRAIGDYRTSESVDRAAVDHLFAERGDRDLEYLRAAGGLAADLRGLARYQEALELSRFTYEHYRDLVGESDALALGAQNNLAVSLRLLGSYEEALGFDVRTLRLRLEVLGPRHSTTLYSEINRAIDLRLLGRYHEARTAQEQSFHEHVRVLGAGNPQTLRAAHNLALCTYHAGDPATALPLFLDIRERSSRVLGNHDPLTMMITASCACAQREHGDLERARALQEDVVDGYTEMLGHGHPYTIGVRGNLGLVLRSLSERQAAYVIERAHQEMARAVGEDHPWTIGCALNATAARALAGDTESAEALSRDTARRAEATLGRRHPLTLSCRIALAADLRALRRRPEADRIEEEALVGLSATLGPQHVHTASARSRNRPSWDFEPLII